MQCARFARIISVLRVARVDANSGLQAALQTQWPKINDSALH